MRIAIVYHPTRMSAVEDKIQGSGRKLKYPTLTLVRKKFQRVGYKVVTIDGRGNLIAKIKRAKPNIVFNFYSVAGKVQAYVPALLEKMGMPYTGCSALCHALAMHKGLASKVFRYDKVPVPSFAVVSRKRREPSRKVEFPVLVKPCNLGSSEGISEESFVSSAAELPKAINAALKVDQEAVITKYILGREMTVGIIGNKKLQILPILEKHFETSRGAPRIFTEKIKRKSSHWHKNVTVPEMTIQKEIVVKKVAARAYRSMGCTDYARVDIRLDKKGIPWVLEVNTLPGIYPKFSPLVKMASELGKNAGYLALRILEEARERYDI